MMRPWTDEEIPVMRLALQQFAYTQQVAQHQRSEIAFNLDLYLKQFLSPTRPAESLVTPEPLGRGGIPAAPPSAPSSECLAVPTQSGPRHKDSAGIDRDPRNVTRVDTGRPHHGMT